MDKLSRRQQDILDVIKTNVKEKGYPPSVREIGEAVGLASSSTVHGHLERLEKKGYIRRDATKPRAIEILTDDYITSNFNDEVVKVPIIGKVTAGDPITAIENIEDYFPLPSNMVSSKDIFMLTVSGESMIDVGINDGDFVIVEKQSTANNGEIVVAMNEENEATVKRFFKEKNYFRLQPENHTMEPIILENVSVLGKVIGVFREMQ